MSGLSANFLSSCSMGKKGTSQDKNFSPYVNTDKPLVLGHAYIKGVLDGVNRLGYSPEDVLVKAGLSPDIYNDPTSCISGEQFNDLCTAITREIDDMFLGFLEQPGKIALEREQFRARMRCGTLGEAIRVSTQFREAVRNDVTYDYVLNDDKHEFSLLVNYKLCDNVDQHIFYWHRFLVIYRYYCWLTGKRIKLNSVSFASPKPEYCADYQKLFDCDIKYNQPVNGISFDQRFLHFPVLPKSEEDQQTYLTKHITSFDIHGDDLSWSRKVRKVIVEMQKQGHWTPTINEVADSLAVGARTLRRLLVRENTNFLTIKAKARSDEAIKMLITTDLSVSVISELVGFCEPGDFTRAFISWTGITPSNFRAQHRSDKALIASYSARASAQDRDISKLN